MDAVQRQLLSCLAAYRTGADQAECLPDLTREDWTALRQLSSIHKLSPVVFDTLRTTDGFCGADRQMRQQWKQETMLQAVGQAARSQRIIEISQCLHRHGIPHALMKGLLCRELYTRPDLRLSGDEDLFIRAADQPRCHSILQETGLLLLSGLTSEDVTHWQDPSTGLHIELHNSLSPLRPGEETWLAPLYEEQLSHTVTVPVTGGEVDTLSPTYHFAFLVCHALKHFLAGGVGVRTLCDILSFAQKYHRDIDRDAVTLLLEKIRGRIFLDQIFALGQRYLDFDPQVAGWSYVCRPEPEALLLDSLEAGIYGQSSLTRRHSAGLVVQAARQEGAGRPLLSSLFPRRKDMVRRYPVLARQPLLLPACWAHRLGKYALEVARDHGDGNSPRESVSLGKKRMEMMVQYGVFPQGKKKN